MSVRAVQALDLLDHVELFYKTEPGLYLFR